MQPAEPECCLPGDITVTPIPNGYLIGKAMPQLGPGPWWEYIVIVTELDDAVAQARVLARANDAHAWFFDGGEHYRLIPLDESKFSAAPPRQS